MADEKRCKDCEYYRMQEEYWHDHYLIREYHYCAYQARYNEKEVDPNDKSCKNFQSRLD